MKIKAILNAHKKQFGVTLIELLVALSLVGLLVVSASTGLFQFMTRSGPASDSLQAINNVQNAGERIIRDAANAENVDITSGYPVFTWHDYGWNDDAHKTTVTYFHSADGSLSRTVQYGVSTAILPQKGICATNVFSKGESKGSTLLILSISPLEYIFECYFNNDRSGESPHIWTDKGEYAPGENIRVRGQGFWPGECIRLFALGSPNGLHFDGEATTDENGGFSASMQLPQQEDGTYLLTATGRNSGLMAQTSIKDARSAASVSVGPQNGTLTQGTAGSATYSITVSSTGSGNGSSALTITGLPSGATGAFSPATVNFSNGTPSPIATLTINTTSAVPAGSYTFTVQASGGSQPTNTGTLVVISGKITTNTTLTSSNNPCALGQSVTFTATVSPSAATGNVQFKIDGTNFGSSVNLSGGSATSGATASLTTGSHTITAIYSGDASYSTSTGNLTQTVNLLVSITTLTSSNNPCALGQSVTFTATVSPGAATGNVQFKIDGTNFGSSVNLSGGSATSGATASLTTGSHTITAIYGGDASYSTSTGNLTQTVNLLVSTTTLTSSNNPCALGQSVTFTATVSPSGATGTVQFTVDGSNFGSGIMLFSGAATSNATTSLTEGNHTVTAVYSGDSSYSGSTGALTGGQRVNNVTAPGVNNGTSLISRNTTISNIQLLSGGILTLTITSTVGTGSNQTAESRTLKMIMRNYLSP